MVKMPQEVRETLEKQWPHPLATASADGKPNVVYIGILNVLDDETLVLADNYFNKTAINLESNPWASIVCWTKEPKRSYQIKGRVSFCDEGEIFDDIVDTVYRRNPKIKVRRAAIMKIEEIYEASSGASAGERIA